MNNTGHGHVFPRDDGVKARCGGPEVCDECATDFVAKGLLAIRELRETRELNVELQAEIWELRQMAREALAKIRGGDDT